MRRFFLLEKTSSARASNDGASTISTKTLFISLAISSVHFLFIAIIPPKADKLSALNAFL